MDEKKEEAQERSRKYRQRMTEAYGRMTRERVFSKGQLVLKAVDHVRQSVVGPYKLSPKYEEPLVIREAHARAYYRLA